MAQQWGILWISSFFVDFFVDGKLRLDDNISSAACSGRIVLPKRNLEFALFRVGNEGD
jgi:hypothetical protein